MRTLARTVVTTVTTTTIIVSISLLLLEGVLVMMFHFPSMSPIPIEISRSLYMREIRDIIQFNAECSQYDPYVTYVLRPGTCVFSNLEFETKVHVNSKGLRDDEESLDQPEIISIGDSFTMGWGVQGEDSFSDVIEKARGMKTLNAGMSSYGTVRELRLLERLDTKNSRYLVLQYSRNDVRENAAFYKNNELRIADESRYQQLTEANTSRRGYFPGKYAIATSIYVWNWLRRDAMFHVPEKTAVSASLDEEMTYLIHALLRANVELSNLRLVIFELNSHGKNRPEFAQRLKETLNAEDVPYWLKETIVIDTSTLLDESDYFLIDDHITAEGHKKIAAAILRELE